MELLNKYKEEIKQDLVIDDFNIKQVQMRLPARKHFWVARLIDAKILHQKLCKQKKDLKKNIVKTVIQESPVRLTVQSAEQSAENHDSIQQINKKIEECQYIIEYLEKVEKILSQMHWEIKNIVDIQRMEQE